jgi:glutamine synthetase
MQHSQINLQIKLVLARHPRRNPPTPAAHVMKMINDNEVKFVDFRFTDTRGKEQHVTVPVSHFDEDKFTEGHAFDASSIAGWKGVECSDMLLMPDPATAAFIDPFFEEPTLLLTCDVLEPDDGKAYDRDPRSIARRAEAYLKSSGLGDTAFFGPEPEFFVSTASAGTPAFRAALSRLTNTRPPGTAGATLTAAATKATVRA